MARKTFLDVQMGAAEPAPLNCKETFQSIAMALAFVGVIYLISLALCAMPHTPGA